MKFVQIPDDELVVLSASVVTGMGAPQAWQGTMPLAGTRAAGMSCGVVHFGQVIFMLMSL